MINFLVTPHVGQFRAAKARVIIINFEYFLKFGFAKKKKKLSKVWPLFSIISQVFK